ncbi:class I SAM-dependent methyltransferase [bacterium]|nr:class I SAM-dependent methyltransferase [bacterium]
MDWYLAWFGEDYFELYGHRNEVEASAQVDFLASQVDLKPPHRVIDIGCGAGRHLKSMQKFSDKLYGIDTSLTALKLAKTTAPRLNLALSDMRSLPFPNAEFDLATSFFTSFGYFKTDAEHFQVLQEWKRILKPSGKLFLDLPNREHVMNTLNPRSEKSINQKAIVEERSLSKDQKRVEKVITISSPQKQKKFTESVRLFSFEEIKALLNAAGFKIKSKFGAHAKTAYTSQSERLVIITE